MINLSLSCHLPAKIKIFSVKHHPKEQRPTLKRTVKLALLDKMFVFSFIKIVRHLSFSYHLPVKIKILSVKHHSTEQRPTVKRSVQLAFLDKMFVFSFLSLSSHGNGKVKWNLLFFLCTLQTVPALRCVLFCNALVDKTLKSN